jgi:thiamine monophosphate synthase
LRCTGSSPSAAFTEASIAQVWEAGADSAAIISDILGADNIADKVKRILALHQVL